MSNRRKLKRRRKQKAYTTPFKEEMLKRLEVPKQEKVVHKIVPAKANGEVIGKAVVYEDGTVDIITLDGISEDAVANVKDFQDFMMGNTPGDDQEKTLSANLDRVSVRKE